MKIEVTQKHIDDALAQPDEIKHMRSCSCPVARAITDALGEGYAQVTHISVDVWGDDGFRLYNRIDLSGVVTDWILSFDKGVSVYPFIFELDIVN